MAGKNTAVFGIYPSYENVENAVDALRSAGFRSADISALFPEGAGTKAFAHEKNTKAPEGATTGAGTGAAREDPSRPGQNGMRPLEATVRLRRDLQRCRRLASRRRIIRWIR